MAKKILIVEDYADTRSLMKFLIKSYGYHVLEATNGQEAHWPYPKQLYFFVTFTKVKS